MTEQTILLPSDTLKSKVKETTKQALEKGALQPIPTECEIVEDDGIPFSVRVVSNLVRKQEAQKHARKDFNPFLPYDRDLFVCDISDTHLCILNKYNVVDEHLLIITRAFAEQESLLDLADFTALWAVLEQFDGLAFYNGGKIAGASVRHKHLQLIPFPPTAPKIPIEPAIDRATSGNIPAFPFIHAFAKLDGNRTSIYQKAANTLTCYRELFSAVGLSATDGDRQSAPYNFLMTKEWMLVVPRLLECYRSISINSVGFAGAFLVADRERLQIVKDTKPMNILKSVALIPQTKRFRVSF